MVSPSGFLLDASAGREDISGMEAYALPKKHYRKGVII
jgi:hypothetical protein